MPAAATGGPGLAEILTEAVRVRPPGLSGHQWKVINTLIACRTPVLGGHRYHCDHCGAEHFVPRSCGNRHCPACQSARALEWLEKQRQLLLPVPYFHVVFTLPHSLNGLIARNQTALYNLLFASASQTLLAFGQRHLGGKPGITAVLHTWSQRLTDHYHLHCLVTGGALCAQGHWCRAHPRFLFPVRALAAVFRGKFIAGLRRLFAKGRLAFHGQPAASGDRQSFETLLTRACAKPWNVYSKRPFAGPEQVLGYFSRYTHRVALSPGRLLWMDIKRRRMRFAWKTRDQPPQSRIMELSLEEFLRRFALHILPPGFTKIRHYGLLANRDRQQRLDQLRRLLQVAVPPEPASTETPPAPAEPDPSAKLPVCPRCGHRALRRTAFEPPIRGSPS